MGEPGPTGPTGPTGPEFECINTRYTYAARNGAIDVIDQATEEVVKTFPIPAGAVLGATRIAINPARNELYVSVGAPVYQLLFINATTGEIEQTLPAAVSSGADQNLVFSAPYNRIYVRTSSTANETIEVFDATARVHTASLVGPYNGSLAVNSANGLVYAIRGQNVDVIASDAVIATISTEINTSRVNVDSLTNRIFASSGSQVRVFDGATNELINSFPMTTGGAVASPRLNENLGLFYWVYRIGSETHIEAYNNTTGEFLNDAVYVSSVNPVALRVDQKTERVYFNIDEGARAYQGNADGTLTPLAQFAEDYADYAFADFSNCPQGPTGTTGPQAS